MRRVVKNLDRLSDVLCGVIDMCELLRTVHPDPEWVEECEQAYARLCNFMNELNTHPGMYEVSYMVALYDSTDTIGTQGDTRVLSLGPI
jgi:intermediate peptidase